MSGRGGDHELDVAAILRRAQEPAGLAELRAAIEKLGVDEATRMLSQIMAIVVDTRERLATLGAGIADTLEEIVSAARDAPHLVDTTQMVSHTVEQTIAPLATVDMSVEAPYRLNTNWFHARAVAVLVLLASDRGKPGYATIVHADIGCVPLLVDAVPADLWRAPPGRGHPVEWKYSCLALMGHLRLRVRNDTAEPVLFRITLSGDPSFEDPRYGGRR